MVFEVLRRLASTSPQPCGLLGSGSEFSMGRGEHE